MTDGCYLFGIQYSSDCLELDAVHRGGILQRLRLLLLHAFERRRERRERRQRASAKRWISRRYVQCSSFFSLTGSRRVAGLQAAQRCASSDAREHFYWRALLLRAWTLLWRQRGIVKALIPYCCLRTARR